MDYQNDDTSFVMYKKWKMWIQNNVKRRRNKPLSNNELKKKDSLKLSQENKISLKKIKTLSF